MGHILSDTFNLTFLPHYVLGNIIQAALVYLKPEWAADRLYGGSFITTPLSAVLGSAIKVHGYLHGNPMYAAFWSGFIAKPLLTGAGLAIQVHCFLHNHPGFAAFAYGMLCDGLFDYWVPDQPEQGVGSEAHRVEPQPVQKDDEGKTKHNAIPSSPLSVAGAMGFLDRKIVSLIYFSIHICCLPIYATATAVSLLRSSSLFSSGPQTATALQEAREELAKERSVNQQKIISLLEDHDKDRKKWANNLEQSQNTAMELRANNLEAMTKAHQTLIDLIAEKEAHNETMREAMAACKDDYGDLVADFKDFKDIHVNAMEALKENIDVHKKLMAELETFLREGKEEREQKLEPEPVGAWGRQLTWTPSKAPKAKKKERG